MGGLMRNQRGFTLIEVVVAFLVTAIGIIGSMGLQNLAIQNNLNAQNQVYGAYLAYDMVDRIRANRAAIGDYAGDVAAAGVVGGCGPESANICAPSDRAQTDQAQWYQALQAALGEDVEAVVCIDSDQGNDGSGSGNNGCDGAGETWAIKIWWFAGEDAAGQNADNLIEALNIDYSQEQPSFYLTFRP